VNAYYILPPPHPKFPKAYEQSINYYSDNEGNATLPNIFHALSIDPVAENA